MDPASRFPSQPGARDSTQTEGTSCATHRLPDLLAPVRQARSRTRESVNRYGSAAYLTASTMPQTATVAYTTENIAISKRPAFLIPSRARPLTRMGSS